MKKFLLLLSFLIVANLGAMAEEPTYTLDFADAPVVDAIAFYSKLIGKEVVYDNSVDGKITLKCLKPLTKEQAVKMIEAAFALNGGALMPSDDEKTVKMIVLTKGHPLSFWIPVVTAVADLPKDDRVASLVCRLHYIDARTLADVLTKQPSSDPANAFTPFSRAGLLMVTGRSSLLPAVAKLIESLDVPSAAGSPTPGLETR